MLQSDGEGYGFEVFSEAVGVAGAWRRHATGRLRATGSVPQLPIDADGVRFRCGASISGEKYYAELTARGFEYGPAFAGITRMWRSATEILAEVRVAEPIADDINDFAFHPALLDACLQTALGLAPSERTFVPLKIDRLELWSASTDLIAHAVRRVSSADAKAYVCDIRIADASGAVVGVVEGISLYEATATEAWQRWLYEPTWRQVDAMTLGHERSRTPKLAGRWRSADARACARDAAEQWHDRGALCERG